MLQIPAKMLLVLFSVTTSQRHGQFPAAAAFAILSTNLGAYFLQQNPAPPVAGTVAGTVAFAFNATNTLNGRGVSIGMPQSRWVNQPQRQRTTAPTVPASQQSVDDHCQPSARYGLQGSVESMSAEH